MNDIPHPAIETDEGQRESLTLLDKELDRLPDKYRVPIVLCVLKGRSRKEAACTLGLAEGTLSWRLAQAKKMLAKRFARRGLVISGVSLAAVMAPGIASACLRASTAKAAFSAEAVPAQVPRSSSPRGKGVSLQLDSAPVGIPGGEVKMWEPGRSRREDSPAQLACRFEAPSSIRGGSSLEKLNTPFGESWC